MRKLKRKASTERVIHTFSCQFRYSSSLEHKHMNTHTHTHTHTHIYIYIYIYIYIEGPPGPIPVSPTTPSPPPSLLHTSPSITPIFPFSLILTYSYLIERRQIHACLLRLRFFSERHPHHLAQARVDCLLRLRLHAFSVLGFLRAHLLLKIQQLNRERENCSKSDISK